MKDHVWLFLGATMLAAVACGPGGPSYDDLAAEPVFATAMPGATEIGTGGSNPRWNIEGSTYGYAVRILASDEDASAVMAWHLAALEADGWTIADFSPIAMRDGHFTEHAWQRGDRVIGLGFPDRDDVAGIPGAADAATVYEISIAYRPAE